MIGCIWSSVVYSCGDGSSGQLIPIFFAMRRLLIAAAVLTGVSFAVTAPVEAKSIWLKCGSQEINLDSAKERYSLALNGKIYQGSAMFSPGQIDFETHWNVMPPGIPGGLKYSYAINRKSLGYEMKTFVDLGYSNIPVWSLLREGPPEAGKCSIMKTPPNTGNKI